MDILFKAQRTASRNDTQDDDRKQTEKNVPNCPFPSETFQLNFSAHFILCKQLHLNDKL